MTHPALEYAEKTLGVHTIFEEANLLDAQLNELLTALDKAQDERRDSDEKIEDRELDLVIVERGKHADMSEAGMTRHLKVVYNKDPELRSLRAKRQEAANLCSGTELDIDYTKSRLRTMQARMMELGGYLQYLAATKLAEIEAEKTTQPTQESK